MHIGQALVRNAQLHAACGIDLDHVYKLPGNAVRVKFARNRFQRRARQHAFEDPPKGSAQANFHFGHAQKMRCALAHPLQVHIVHADHFSSMNIDDLAVHQVLLQIEVVPLVLQRHHRAR
jgi:hypothetical protein